MNAIHALSQLSYAPHTPSYTVGAFAYTPINSVLSQGHQPYAAVHTASHAEAGSNHSSHCRVLKLTPRDGTTFGAHVTISQVTSEAIQAYLGCQFIGTGGIPLGR